jgi:hypothetical protein
MADAETVKFKKTAEKLCIDCVVDVDKLLSQCRQAVSTRLFKLAKDIVNVPGSEHVADTGQLDKFPAEINEILEREGSDFKSVVVLGVQLRVGPGGKLSSPAVNLGGLCRICEQLSAYAAPESPVI